MSKQLKDKSLEIIKEASPVIKQVQELSITVSKDLIPATELLSKINKYADTLKIDRLSLTAPLEESLKLIRAKYTPTEKLLKEAVDTLKQKMGNFQTEQLRIQRLEEAKIASKLESGYIKPETAIDKMGEVKQVDNKVRTEEGLVSFREEKDFEVVDVSLLPIKFLLPNEVEIRKQLKAGIELSGCRYFMKQIINNRRS
jgi:hypothetical protein